MEERSPEYEFMEKWVKSGMTHCNCAARLMRRDSITLYEVVGIAAWPGAGSDSDSDSVAFKDIPSPCPKQHSEVLTSVRADVRSLVGEQETVRLYEFAFRLPE